jgi:hypothetical protein
MKSSRPTKKSAVMRYGINFIKMNIAFDKPESGMVRLSAVMGQQLRVRVKRKRRERRQKRQKAAAKAAAK